MLPIDGRLMRKISIASVCLHYAEQSKTDEAVQQLHKDICTALNLPDSEHIAYTDLYDSLTARKFHDKGWPPGMTEDLYIRIEKEAFRCNFKTS